jgi:hypothetical protein
MMRSVAMAVAVTLLFCLFVFGISGATEYATLSHQIALQNAQANSLRQYVNEGTVESRQRVVMERQLRKDIGNNVRFGTLPMVEALQRVSQDNHVSIQNAQIKGPLAPPPMLPAPLPVLVATPPPAIATPVPQQGFNQNLGAVPTPSASLAPGFERAKQLTGDPVSYAMQTYAGSVDFVGRYYDVIGALQEFPRAGAFLRVISGSSCRLDNTSPLRKVSVAFRFYAVPDGFGS